MAWLVLSTTSLLDDQRGSSIPQDKLESMVRRSGYKTVTLLNIMRNSAKIATATSPENVDRYGSGVVNIPRSISAGSCSTVTGTRPTCYLYKYSDAVNYPVIARAVNQYLNRLSDFTQTVILCDQNISPRKVKPLLTCDVTLYDGDDAGVEEFDGLDNNRPRVSSIEDLGRLERGSFMRTTRSFGIDLYKQKEDLVKWIHNGGALLTHDKMFNGCEAENIIFLTKLWGGGQTRRSGPTRAVSQLCLVTSDGGINEDEIKQHFTVIDMREDQAVSQSGEEEEETNTD